MITREKALGLLHKHMQSINLRRHCYSVEAVMRGLAKHFGEDEEKWGIVGLLHDGDYEATKDDLANHAKKMANWVREAGEDDPELLESIESHGWFHEGKLPQTRMQWSLYCCDELTGLIVAVALVRPDKKLASVAVDSISAKWKQKAFAGGVDRDQIELCEKQLGIALADFIEIALVSMQAISSDLGL